MARIEKYAQYTSFQFSLDDLFVRWVKDPNELSEKFWSDFLIRFPEKKPEIEKAISIVNQMKIVKERIDRKKEQLIWKQIESRIQSISKYETKPVLKRIFYYAAAACLAALFLAGYFYFNKGSLDQPVNEHLSAAATHDIAPGGNKAILTLADGSKIILDSANNGAITKQGNVTVIKLSDGQVAYQPTTHNSQLTITKYNTISTPRGGQYQLELADGSRVWLNAASSITFPTSLTGNRREVNITGEVYFEVAHNADMPFHVKVNDMDVEVLGTHFNINSYEDEGAIKTTLLEGSVKVSYGNKSVRIEPGEEARIKSDNNNIEIKKDINPDEVIAWKNGLFQFNQADIQNIMRQISRWYDVDVEFRGMISKETFTGIVSRNVNVSQVLEIMKQAGIKFKIEGRKIIVI